MALFIDSVQPKRLMTHESSTMSRYTWHWPRDDIVKAAHSKLPRCRFDPVATYVTDLLYRATEER